MSDLEQQIEELNITIELLSLDKEQLVIDKELLEEKILELQQEITHLKASSSSTPVKSSSSATASLEKDVRTLQDENSKLRDAVVKFNNNNKTDKDLIEQLEKQLKELSLVSAEFDEYRRKTEIELNELRSQVDSLSSFENILEKLTNENLSLSSSLSEAKNTIQLLEDTIELNEELDEQQRQTIDSDRQVIHSLEMKINQFDAKIIEKDLFYQDILKKFEIMKESYFKEKNEKDELILLLSNENENYQKIEKSIKLLSFYSNENEVLKKSTFQKDKQFFQLLLQRYKYQILSLRYDNILSSSASSFFSSFYLKENKSSNYEIVYFSLLSFNLELQRLLNKIYIKISFYSLQNEVSSKLSFMILQIIMFSISFHSFLFHEIFTSLTSLSSSSSSSSSDSSSLVSFFTTEKILLLKNEFESFLPIVESLCLQCESSSIPPPPTTTEAATIESSSGKETNEGKDTDSILVKSSQQQQLQQLLLSNKEIENYYSKFSQFYMNFNRLTSASSSSTSDHPSSSPLSTMISRISSTFLVASASASTGSPSLTSFSLESIWILIGFMIESLSLSSLDDGKKKQQEAESNHHNGFVEVIKSLKVEIEMLFSSFLYSSTSKNQKEYESCMMIILPLFLSFMNSHEIFTINNHMEEEEGKGEQNGGKDEEKIQKLKSILFHIQKLNNNNNSNTDVITNTSSSTLITLNYYPSSSFSIILSSSSSASASASSSSSVTIDNLSLNYYQILNKYWELLYRETSDFPFSSSSSGQGGGGMIEFSWKKRLTMIRDSLSSLFSEYEQRQKKLLLSSSLDEQEDLSSSPSIATLSLSSPSSSMKEDSGTASSSSLTKKHQTTLKELNIKNDELKSARNRCIELQSLLDNAMKSLSSSSSSTSSSLSTDSLSVSHYQSEIKTLESALQTLESRVDSLNKENKQLKSQLNLISPSPTSASSSVNTVSEKLTASTSSTSTSGNATAASKEKPASRRRQLNNLDLSDAKAMLNALGGGSSSSSTPSSGPTALGVFNLSGIVHDFVIPLEREIGKLTGIWLENPGYDSLLLASMRCRINEHVYLLEIPKVWLETFNPSLVNNNNEDGFSPNADLSLPSSSTIYLPVMDSYYDYNYFGLYTGP
jgi:hypothetical protein